jgi:WD40 repeat protein
MVAKEGQLPTKWGEDQIAPILQNSAMRARWGSTKTEALKKVVALAAMAEKARRNLQLGEFQKQLAAWLTGGALLIAFAGSLYYYQQNAVIAKEAQKMAEARRITALARDALWSDGPAMAILVASKVQDLGLEEVPETERLLLTSLHQLREERILAREHRQMVNGLSYSPNGAMLVSSDPASLLFSHAESGANSESGVPVETIPLSYLPIKNQHFTGPILSAQWSPGGNWIAAGARDQTLLIAPCSHKDLKGLFAGCAGHDDDIVQVIGSERDRTGAAQFSVDGRWMATGSYGATVKLWDVSTLPISKLREFPDPISWPNAFAISSDKKWIATGPGQQGVIRVFDASSGDLKASLEVGQTQHGSFVAIAFNPADPQMLVASTSDGSIFAWNDWSDPRAAKSPSQLENTRGGFQIAFSPDGRYLVVAGDDGVLRMWARDGKAAARLRPIGELRGHKGPVWAIAVSPDGNHIASGSSDGSRISWSRLSAFHITPGAANPVAASTAEDSSLCSRDIELSHDLEPPVACARSPRGRIVAAFADGRIQEFNVQGAAVAVDSYRLPEPVASIKLAGDRLVIETQSGARSEWPFFDSLEALVEFAHAHLPYDGAERVKLPEEILCRIDDRSAGCNARSMLSLPEGP